MLRREFIAGAASGLVIAAVPASAIAETKPGRWMRFESPHFVFLATGDEGKARDDLIALERYHEVLSMLIPRQQRSDMKLAVYSAANPGDLNRVWPGVPAGVAGFYDASLENVRAVTAPFRTFERQKDMPSYVRAMDARVVLFHEYAHHFMKANLQLAYPAWYSEGFAEFASTVDFTSDGAQVGKFTSARSNSLTYGDWLSIDKFLVRGELSNPELNMYYAQAWLATHYIFTNVARAEGFDKYVAALSSGADVMKAFEPSFGITTGQFDKELREYRRQNTTIFVLPLKKRDYSADIKKERLSAAGDELVMTMAYLRSVQMKDDAKAMDAVAFVRAEAKKYPDDRIAQVALATSELWYGAPAIARSLLDALLAADPKDAEIQHLSGMCDLRQGYQLDDGLDLFKRARKQFAEAHRLDPTRAHSLYRYVECLLHIEDDFTPHMLDVSLEAYRLAPQITVIKLLAAQGLMQFERWKEAQAILRALMGTPHESDSGNRIHDLMDAALAEKALEVTFYAAANTMELRGE